MREEQGGSLCPWRDRLPFLTIWRTGLVGQPLPLPGGQDREKGGVTDLLQAGVQLGQDHLSQAQAHLGHLSTSASGGVAPPPPAPHSGQGLCFLLFQVLSAEAQRFQHPKWDVALLGLECLLDGKAAWTRNHASIQLIPSESHPKQRAPCQTKLKTFVPLPPPENLPAAFKLLGVPTGSG